MKYRLLLFALFTATVAPARERNEKFQFMMKNTSFSTVLIFSLFMFCSPMSPASAQRPDSLLAARQVDSLVNLNQKLVEERKFEEALPFIEQAEQLALAAFGRESAAYGNCRHNNAGTLNKLNKLDEAEPLYLDALDIRAKVLGKEHPDYAASLNSLGNLYWNKGDYTKAEPLYLEAKDIRAKVLGKEHPDYASSLINLGNLYSDKGDYTKAEPLYLEAKDIRAKALGKEHPGYASSLINLAILYSDKGDYTRAEPLYLEAKDIRAKVLGKEHPDYASSLHSLAILYSDKGDYTKAEPLFLEAKNIRAKVLGKEHPHYASSLNSLAILYSDKGDYTKAELLFLEAKDIRAEVLGKEHPGYASSLYNLGNLYRDKGDYTKAEPLYLEAKDIRAKALGKEHPLYASSLTNLANIYSDKGDYTKAEPLYLEAKDINAKALGKEHPSYTTSLINLAGIYLKKGDYTKAEPLYLEAKDIRAKVLGKEHPAYAWSLEYLATLYRDKGDYTKAEPLYLEAKGIMAKVLGKEHPNYAWGLYNLASLYSDKGDYTKAEPLFLEAKDIRVKVLGKEHPTYAWNLGDLSFLYQVTLRIPEARQTWLELNPLIQRLINQSATYSSENQMDAYVRTFDGHINKCFSFAQAHPSPEILRAAYDNALFFNGYLLENARSLARAYDHAGPAARDTFERWQGCLRRLAGEYTKPIAERRFVAETEAEAEVYEKALTRNLAAFGETRKQPHWNDVCDRLNADEAAVEFVRYPFFNPKRTDSVMYAAFILKPGWDSPRMVTLFEEKSIRFDGNAAQKSYELYAARGVKPLSQGNNKLTIDLYRLIWEPLQTHLKGTKKVYFATSGQLAQLNMGAIPIGKGKVLADRYTLAQLGSTRQLIKPRAFSTQNQTALLFGGIRYEADTAAIAQANTSLGHAIASRGLLDIADTDSTLKKDKWDYLPGTENEVNAIEKILLTGGLEPRTGRSYAATEEAFKAIGSAGQASPRVLHVATHGFFFPEVKDGQYDANEPVFKTSDNPLIRSGLILSGGNHAWQTGRPIRPGMEDGILTAYEISQMNLSNTELVVLSACETGLGDIQGNEGVYGLQRAFKIAGAKYLIMSLWQVPDRQTSLLMTAFYKKWLVEKLPVPEAFRAAQNELRDAGLDPYQWAGFVLVE